jgi:hypothetical protein
VLRLEICSVPYISRKAAYPPTHNLATQSPPKRSSALPGEAVFLPSAVAAKWLSQSKGLMRHRQPVPKPGLLYMVGATLVSKAAMYGQSPSGANKRLTHTLIALESLA